MLDGIQGVAPAADQVAQIVAHQIHPVGIGLFVLPAVGHVLGAHVPGKALNELLNLFLHGAGGSGSVRLGRGRLLGLLGLSGLLRLLGLPGCIAAALVPALVFGPALALGLGSLGGLLLGRFLLDFGGLGRFRLGGNVGGLGLRAGGGGQRHLRRFRHGVGGFVSHLYLGRLGTETQEAGLGLLEHLDGDTVPVQTQGLKRGLNGKVNGLAGCDDILFHDLFLRRL